jgi:thiosulfate dehydrogenase [quinone] large subunit
MIIKHLFIFYIVILNGAINNPVIDKATGEAVYPTYVAFLENFALPNIKLINIMIP